MMDGSFLKEKREENEGEEAGEEASAPRPRSRSRSRASRAGSSGNTRTSEEERDLKRTRRRRENKVSPVGAVSTTTRENRAYFSDCAISTTLAMATASSSPGGGESSSSPSFRSASWSASMPSPKPPSTFLIPAPPSLEAAADHSSLAASGSISRPHSGRSVPSTGTGLPPETSWSSESERECAGSVETTSVEWPAAASATAREAESEVFPTPPLPETIMYLRSVPAAMSSNADREASTGAAAGEGGASEADALAGAAEASTRRRGRRGGGQRTR